MKSLALRCARSLAAGLALSFLCLPVAGVRAADAAKNDGQPELERAEELHLKAESLHDLDEVVALAEKALRRGLDPANAELAHQLAASALFQHGASVAAAIVDRQRPSPRWASMRTIALTDLEKAVQHNKNLTEAYELICKLSVLPEGDETRGLEAATELIRLLGDDKSRLAEAYVWRARFRDKPEDRLADLEKATEADPNSNEAWQLRAAVLYQGEDYQKAADAYRELLKKDDKNATLHLALAEALANIDGQYDEALKHIAQAIELDPKSTAGYLLRARLQASKENLDAAFVDLEQALKIDPSDTTTLLLRAELYLFRDDAKAARDDVEKALRSRPGLVLGILLRSRISAAEKKYDEAIKDIELLIQNDPQNVDYKLQMALYYNADDRPRKAIKLLTEILDQDKDNWRILRTRGDALLSVGKHEEAIQDYDAALKVEPEDSGLLNNLAWVLATSPDDKVRDGKRALELALKACEVTKYKEAHILSTLASAYAETGDFDMAKQWSEKAVELGEGEMKEQLKKELESYVAKKPWREKQETKEKPDIAKRNLLET